MTSSIKTKILDFLKKGDWVYGGQIEDFIRTTDGHKASNASRRCRELEDVGKIESRYVNVQGVANKVVQYRLKSFMTAIYTMGCCYSATTFKDKQCNPIHSSTCPMRVKETAKGTLF